MDIDEQLLIACGDGHLVLVAMLLKLGADPSADDNWAIRYASENGHLEVVRLLQEDPRVIAAGWRRRGAV